MGRENFCLRLTDVRNNEPVYVMIDGIAAFTKVLPKKEDSPEGAKSYGSVILHSGKSFEVKETPQEIVQLAKQTGILTSIPQG